MIGEVNNRGHQEVSFNNEGDIPSRVNSGSVKFSVYFGSFM